MRRLVQSRGYARAKFLNGCVFIALGTIIVLEFARGVGLRFEGAGGYALGAALIVLGGMRVRAGWPK